MKIKKCDDCNNFVDDYFLEKDLTSNFVLNSHGDNRKKFTVLWCL